MSVVLARKIGVAVVLAAGPIILFSHFLWTLDEGHPAELLQQTANLRVRSSSYYARLAQTDSWVAVKDHARKEGGATVLAVRQLHIASRNARMQSLANWNSGALAGTGPLVTECAKGLESACDELAKDPAALNALKTMDSSNPSGYAASHARAPAAYTPSVPAAQTLATYQTAPETKSIWSSLPWQSGSVQESTNTQWLKSCGEGNYYACEHIANDGSSLRQLMTPKLKTVQNQLPAPVYTAQKSGGGFFTGLSKMLGLTDSYYAGGDDYAQVPKMVPDSGLQRGNKAVYNDGTVADMLTDSPSTQTVAGM